MSTLDSFLDRTVANPMKKAAIIPFLISIVCMPCRSACGEPILFKFEGFVGAGALDGTSLDGQNFVVNGSVTNESNLSPFDCCGVFAADATFEFEDGRSFTAKPDSTFFSQQFTNLPGEGPLIQNTLQGKVPDFSNGIFGNSESFSRAYVDARVPEAIGVIDFNLSGIVNGSQFDLEDSTGRALVLSSASFQRLTTVPEPASLVLIVLSLCLLGAVRKARV